MIRLQISKKVCHRCGKGDRVSFNRPKSLHKTKRVVRPNIQFYTDPMSGKRMSLCTRCIRTLVKNSK